MQTFDQALYVLFQNELISYEEALRQASNPDEFKLKMAGIQSTADMARSDMETAMTDSQNRDDGVNAAPHEADSPFEFSNS